MFLKELISETIPMYLTLNIISWNMNNTTLFNIPLIKWETDLIILCLQESFLEPQIVFNSKNSCYIKIKEKQIGGIRSVIYANKKLNNFKIEIFTVPLGPCYLINKGAHLIKIWKNNYTPFSIINVHLIHSTSDIINRHKSINFLIKNFSNENVQIFSGDFNFRNPNEENILKENGFIERLPKTFTYKYLINTNILKTDSKFFTDRIFYLNNSKLVSGKFTVLENELYWSSDHRPLVLDLKLNLLEINKGPHFYQRLSLKVKCLNIWANVQHQIYYNFYAFIIFLLFILSIVFIKTYCL